MFAVLAFPLSCLLFKESLILVFFGSFVALVVVVRHQANIKRLIAGTENRIEWVRNKEKISNF
jgi:glycerol-3-phosphate acyltransferase PlsY